MNETTVGQEHMADKEGGRGAVIFFFFWGGGGEGCCYLMLDRTLYNIVEND